jgi:hypothetical protein
MAVTNGIMQRSNLGQARARACRQHMHHARAGKKYCCTATTILYTSPKSAVITKKRYAGARVVLHNAVEPHTMVTTICSGTVHQGLMAHHMILHTK